MLNACTFGDGVAEVASVPDDCPSHVEEYKVRRCQKLLKRPAPGKPFAVRKGAILSLQAGTSFKTPGRCDVCEVGITDFSILIPAEH